MIDPEDLTTDELREREACGPVFGHNVRTITTDERTGHAFCDTCGKAV